MLEFPLPGRWVNGRRVRLNTHPYLVSSVIMSGVITPLSPKPSRRAQRHLSLDFDLTENFDFPPVSPVRLLDSSLKQTLNTS